MTGETADLGGCHLELCTQDSNFDTPENTAFNSISGRSLSFFLADGLID